MNKSYLFLILLVGFGSYYHFNNKEVVYLEEYSQSEAQLPPEVDQISIGNLKIYTESRIITAGNAFPISSPYGNILVSAAHIFLGPFGGFGDPLSNIESVELISGQNALITNAIPLSGPSYSTCSMTDARNDLAFFSIPPGQVTRAIELADEPALPGQKLWIYCSYPNGQKNLTEVVVTKSSNFGVFYNLQAPIKRNGSSGCPLLNSAGQLQGVNVCIGPDMGIAVPLENIDNFLSEL